MAAKKKVGRSSTAKNGLETREHYMVLRTVYLTPALDDTLRLKAFKERKSKNEIIREILTESLS